MSHAEPAVPMESLKHSTPCSLDLPLGCAFKEARGCHVLKALTALSGDRGGARMDIAQP